MQVKSVNDNEVKKESILYLPHCSQQTSYLPADRILS